LIQQCEELCEKQLGIRNATCHTTLHIVDWIHRFPDAKKVRRGIDRHSLS